VLASDESKDANRALKVKRKPSNIAEQWAKAGLKPAAGDGSWFEPVPLIQRGRGEATYSFNAKGRKLRIASDVPFYRQRKPKCQNGRSLPVLA
jgi:hypothetical protein